MKQHAAWLILFLVATLTGRIALATPVTFSRDFAPSEGWVKPQERPCRDELCLNGRWQFQPVPVPAGYRRDQGIPPQLPPPTAAGWSSTPIKIPSPWNVNTWGNGRDVGPGTPRPYYPDSAYYPSYPPEWDHAEMGWLRRAFRVPAEWEGRRIVLHFEAVAGHCQVLVNGTPAGEHFDRFLPFDLDITSLVKIGAANELLVGIRAHTLYNQASARYPKFRAPYAPGSNLDRIVGIWQDVYLLALPQVRVEDVFVKPRVDQDTLELEVHLRNDTAIAQALDLSAAIHPWVNLAGKDVTVAPEPKWKLDRPVLQLESAAMKLQPGTTATMTLKQRVNEGMLKEWSPRTPNLYAAVIELKSAGQTIDRQLTRFGWRQLKIQGRDLLLNGNKIQLFGDFSHPFGPFMMSRRFAWSWFRMIKDYGGNAVRPHANIYPRDYLDLADEMGIMVLDETGIFGSSIQLNFEAPAAWERFAAHYDGLVLRDRNHPSVFGWSFGNELFAIFRLNNVNQADIDAWYAKLAELGARARRLDPTREWISCDGDEDLRGTLPVWSKHFGHGLPLKGLPGPELNKPLMVGESGGTYYATPGQLAVFNGDRAYESYAGRNEALAIDLYQNVTKMARPRLAYFSPSEMVWFGLEHLALGLRDFSRIPNLNDGIFFAPYVEGKPGMQLERIPPYVTTLNPGYDLSLPLYKPLAMFEAMKAALAEGGPRPCAWDHLPEIKPRRDAPEAARPTIDQVAFAGAADGPLMRTLTEWGVPIIRDPGAPGNGAAKMLIIAGEEIALGQAGVVKQNMDDLLGRGGVVLVMIHHPNAMMAAVNQLLPSPVQLTTREATALVKPEDHPWTAEFGPKDLYFAEEPRASRSIIRCGLDGGFVKRGRVLLEASDTDWSLFNQVPEAAKCGAVVMYEKLKKPAGAALVALDSGNGKIVLSTIQCNPASPAQRKFWHELLGAMGVRLNNGNTGRNEGNAGKKTHDLLLDGPMAQ